MRRRIVAFAILASVLMALAPMAVSSATSNQFVVGSQHTDFGTGDEPSPQTLENLTVSGSGDAATVIFDKQSYLTDSFEDGDLSEYQNVGSVFGTTSDYAADGSLSLEVNATDSKNWMNSNSGLGEYPSAGDDFSVFFQTTVDGAGNAGFQFARKNSSTYVAIQPKTWNDQVTLQVVVNGTVVAGNSTNADLPSGVSHEFDVDWTDKDSITVDIIRKDTGNTVGTISVDATQAPRSGGIGFQNDGTYRHFWDYIHGTAPKTGGAKYVSAIHDVDGAENATINITAAHNVSINTTVRTDSGAVLNRTTLTETGNHTLTLSSTSSNQIETVLNISATGTNAKIELADESILFANHDPTVALQNPGDGAKVTSKTVTFEAQVNDTEFGTVQGDTVTVEYQVMAPGESSFSTVNTQTVTSNQTVTYDYTTSTGGEYKWRVNTSDSYDGSATSATRNFSAPSVLVVREESPPHDKITSATATVKFYEDRLVDPVIVERTATDGMINLTGLPVSSEFSVSVSAPNHNNGTVILSDIYSQSTVFLLDKNVTSIQNRFTVNDRTGVFPPESTELVVQKAINRSEYDSGGWQWTNIAGDDLGADEAFAVTLEEGARYRIKVQNDQGDTRILGAYTAETGGVINLNIGSVVFDPTGDSIPTMEAMRTNESGQPVRVTFEYNDSDRNTSAIHLKIYEYKNESNVLVSNTTYSGTYGTFTHTADVPAAENSTTWVVEFTAERASGQYSGKIVVGAQTDTPITQMAPWLMSFIFVASVFSVAGLFSQLNGDIGSLVVAGMGGLFWFTGFAPPQLGSGVVALSMVTAAILFVRERRDGGL